MVEIKQSVVVMTCRRRVVVVVVSLSSLPEIDLHTPGSRAAGSSSVDAATVCLLSELLLLSAV